MSADVDTSEGGHRRVVHQLDLPSDEVAAAGIRTMDLDAMAEAIGCTVNDARALRRYIERGTLRKAHELAHKLGVYLDFTLVPRHASERYLRHVRETAGEAVTRDVPA